MASVYYLFVPLLFQLLTLDPLLSFVVELCVLVLCLSLPLVLADKSKAGDFFVSLTKAHNLTFVL